MSSKRDSKLRWALKTAELEETPNEDKAKIVAKVLWEEGDFNPAEAFLWAFVVMGVAHFTSLNRALEIAWERDEEVLEDPYEGLLDPEDALSFAN